MIFPLWSNTINKAYRLCLDFLLPPRCLGCHQLIQDPLALCGQCWKSLSFLKSPQCFRCGFPFDFSENEDEHICAQCLKNPPPFDRGRSIVRYDDGSKHLLLKFKHGDHTEFAPLFTQWFLQTSQDFFEEIDLIIPVPLHPWRLLKRQYNQAALLARMLSFATHIPWSGEILVRKKSTVSQGHLSFKARHRNVKNAFFCSPEWKKRLSYSHCLLIDDVWTSGATIHACCETLLRSGSEKVSVLTIARAFSS